MHAATLGLLVARGIQAGRRGVGIMLQSRPRTGLGHGPGGMSLEPRGIPADPCPAPHSLAAAAFSHVSLCFAV